MTEWHKSTNVINGPLIYLSYIAEKFNGNRCPDKWFKCAASYECIPYDAKCNGVNDCLDLSDERDCGMYFGLMKHGEDNFNITLLI